MFKHVDKTSFTSSLFLLFLKRLLNEDKVSLEKNLNKLSNKYYYHLQSQPPGKD